MKKEEEMKFFPTEYYPINLNSSIEIQIKESRKDWWGFEVLCLVN